MKTRTLWIVAVSAVIVVVGIVTAFVAFGGGSTAAPTATPTATAAPSTTLTPTPDPSATSAPSPSATFAPPPSDATCDTITTAEWHDIMAANGWVGWETTHEQIGAVPFAYFPGGAPSGQVICRWGTEPHAATDNVADLAWAPLAAADQQAAKDFLLSGGYTVTDPAYGERYVRGVEGQPNVDGYLFTGDDVRWAASADDLQFIQNPNTSTG